MSTNKYDPVSVGNKIREIRMSRGLTMEEFGEKIYPVAHKSIVSRWESGRSIPNNSRLKQIAEIGNISVVNLLKGGEKIMNMRDLNIYTISAIDSLIKQEPYREYSEIFHDIRKIVGEYKAEAYKMQKEADPHRSAI